mmetsp:Transcript_23777/g.93565  ORF Transcript_23777/g.93565 Transcript_23777/m.93565 type:complete len:108 (+) Transcript_23777:85-408(+)
MALAISETGLHELERSFDAVARTVLAEGNSSADQEGIAMKIEEMKNLFMRRVKNELKVEGTDRKGKLTNKFYGSASWRWLSRSKLCILYCQLILRLGGRARERSQGV